MYVCMYVRTYVCMYVRTYVRTYVCMYVSNTHTQTLEKPLAVQPFGFLRWCASFCRCRSLAKPLAQLVGKETFFFNLLHFSSFFPVLFLFDSF